MVATLVLEASAERRESSSLSLPTIVVLIARFQFSLGALGAKMYVFSRSAHTIVLCLYSVE